MDHLDEEIQHQRDLAERRAAWEAQKKAEAEEQARQEARGRMEAWLTAKRQAWLQHTGELAPSEVVTSWKMEYIAEREAAADAERAEKLLNAEDVAAG